MKKQVVIMFFGGATKAAKALGIRRQALAQWPEVLTRRQTNEAVGAIVRQVAGATAVEDAIMGGRHV